MPLTVLGKTAGRLGERPAVQGQLPGHLAVACACGKQPRICCAISCARRDGECSTATGTSNVVVSPPRHAMRV